MTNFENDFGTDQFFTPFNKDRALYIIQNKEQFQHLVTKDDFTKLYDPWLNLEKFLSISKDNEFVTNKYIHSKDAKVYGRFYTTDASLQRMTKILRNTICSDDNNLDMYEDLDMVNAFPSILKSLCIRYEIPCDNLEYYVKNRDTFLQEIMDKSKKTRNEAKEIINVLINAKHDLKLNLPNVEIWDKMKIEVRNAVKTICEKDEYKAIYQKNKKKENPYGSTISLILGNYEKNIISFVFKFCKNEGLIYKDNYLEYMYDGLQIFKKPTDRKKIIFNSDVLDDINKYILKETEFDVKFTQKEMNEKLELPFNFKKMVIHPIYVSDDTDACDKFIEKNRHKFKKCKGVHYLCEDGIWITCSNSVFEEKCINMLKILDFQIMKTKDDDIIYIPYSKTLKNLQNCAKLIRIDDRYIDDSFDKKMFNSNIGFLAFNNGIWDFKNKIFKSFDELPDVYFQTKINRNFNEIRNENHIQNIYEKILNKIFPEIEGDTFYGPNNKNGKGCIPKLQMYYYLNYAARAIAGKIYDKIWAIGVGERNSGKGVLNLLITECFEDFVKSTNSGNYTKKSISAGDNAKANSWMSRFVYRRFALSDEIEGTLDGNKIKMWASGGDSIEMRTNFKDEVDSQIQAKTIINCNTLPKVESKDADCKDTCIVFNYRNKFVSQEKFNQFDEMEKLRHSVKDDTIKSYIKNNSYVLDAFIHIVLDHYTDDFILDELIGVTYQDTEMYRKIDDKDSEDDIIKKYFEITTNSADRLKGFDITKHKNSFNDSKYLAFGKLKEKLSRFGAVYHPKNLRINGTVTNGFTHIKLIKVDDNLSNADTTFLESDNEDDFENKRSMSGVEEEIKAFKKINKY